MIRLPPYRPADTERAVYDYTVTIRGVQVRYRLTWWPRRSGWTADVWADGELLVEGMQLVEGALLGWRHRWSPPLPVGYFVLADYSGAHTECDQAGLGWTHHLWWVEPDDFSEPTTIEVTVT
jgi:hypothetical protein